MDGIAERMRLIAPDDAELIDLCARFREAEAESAATAWAEDELDETRPADERAEALRRHEAADLSVKNLGRRIIRIPPTTLAGFRAKAQAAYMWFGGQLDSGDLGSEMVNSIVVALALTKGDASSGSTSQSEVQRKADYGAVALAILIERLHKLDNLICAQQNIADQAVEFLEKHEGEDLGAALKAVNEAIFDAVCSATEEALKWQKGGFGTPPLMPPLTAAQAN